MQTDRDRLIELFKKIEYTPFPEMTMKAKVENQFTDYALNSIVDYLLANGVIVPKQGKWVIAGKDENDMCIFQCSNCARKQYGATFYCSTCGFEMINAKEREKV